MIFEIINILKNLFGFSKAKKDSSLHLKMANKTHIYFDQPVVSKMNNSLKTAASVKKYFVGKYRNY